MNDNNIAIAKGLVADFTSGNLEGIRARLAEDVRWVFPGPDGVLPLTGTFVGPEQVLDWFISLATDLEILAFAVTDYVPYRQNEVILLGTESVRVRSTNKEYQTHFAHRLTFEAGKLISFREYTDTAVQVAARTN